MTPETAVAAFTEIDLNDGTPPSPETQAKVADVLAQMRENARLLREETARLNAHLYASLREGALEDVREKMRPRVSFGLSCDHHGRWIPFGRYLEYRRETDNPLLMLWMFPSVAVFAWREAPDDETILRDIGFYESAHVRQVMPKSD